MSVGHLHRAAPIDPAIERELETLLNNAEFSAAVSAYDREVCDYDVPYVGGSGTDWRTIYWDRHLCAAIDSGKFLIGGKPVDPRVTGKSHEAVEGAIIHLWPLVMRLLGWPQTDRKYPRAHGVADVAERHAVMHLGWQWEAYQAAWEPFIRSEEKEAIQKPPPNLLLDPYMGSPLYAKLRAAQTGQVASQPGAQAPKLSHARAGYHKGHGRDGGHCGICRHLMLAKPLACEIVQPPIRANDGCELYDPRKGALQQPRKAFDPKSIGARQAPDGHHYLRDPKRPGKYLRVVPRG